MILFGRVGSVAILAEFSNGNLAADLTSILGSFSLPVVQGFLFLLCILDTQSRLRIEVISNCKNIFNSDHIFQLLSF